MAALTEKHLKAWFAAGVAVFGLAGGWYHTQAQAQTAGADATAALQETRQIERRTQRLEDTILPLLQRLEQRQERMETRLETLGGRR